MRRSPLLAFLLLAMACVPVDEELDTPEPPPSGLDLVIGEVVELEQEGEEFRFELARGGEYLIALVSTDDAQGTLHPYVSRAPVLKAKEAGDKPPATRPPGSPPRPKAEVGDLRSFTLHDDRQWLTIEAEAIGVSERVVLWEDQTTPSELEVNYERIDLILQNLEEIVIPREEQLFGAISDVDGDGKIAVLISYTVNMIGVAAYVTWCDINAAEGCTAGNNSEVVYLSIPEPEGRLSSANAITETVAHELSHLIYAYHKHVLNGTMLREGEGIYVTEGLAALAQDLTGYNNGNQYVWGAAFDLAEFYEDENFCTQGISVNDMFGDGSFYSTDRDGVLRGGSYLFLRYLFEQAGGMEVLADGSLVDRGGIAWLRSIYSTPALGAAAIEETMGRDYWDLVFDWYTAILVSGRNLNNDKAFNFEPRVEDPLTGYSFGVDPYALIHGYLQLSGAPVQPWLEADRFIRAGGAEYMRLETEPGTVELWVDPSARARARLIRVN